MKLNHCESSSSLKSSQLPLTQSIVRFKFQIFSMESAANQLTSDKLYAALESIEQIVKDIPPNVRVVCIGEASHGTKEFYQLREEVTRYLIENRGFTLVACEADWPGMERVDNYIHGYSKEDESAKDALQSFTRFPEWMWRNEVMADGVGWCKLYNDLHPSPEGQIKLAGLDLYSLFESAEQVVTYLAAVDPKLCRLAKRYYSCFDSFDRDPQQYAFLTAVGASEGCRREAISVCEMMLLKRQAIIKSQLDADSQSLQEGNSEDALWQHLQEYRVKETQFKAEINAHVTKDAEEYYRASILGGTNSWNQRDKHMMNVLKKLLDHETEMGRQAENPARIVVWAHNSHLGDARYTDMGGDRGQLNLGQLCREQFGQDCYLIGQLTYHGTVTCASDWDGHCEVKSVIPSISSSFEYFLQSLRDSNGDEIPVGYLKLRDSKARELLEDLELHERYIGVIYRPETELQSHYSTTCLALEYDAVIFQKETRAIGRV